MYSSTTAIVDVIVNDNTKLMRGRNGHTGKQFYTIVDIHSVALRLYLATLNCN